jgi:hypothetical protein
MSGTNFYASSSHILELPMDGGASVRIPIDVHEKTKAFSLTSEDSIRQIKDYFNR